MVEHVIRSVPRPGMDRQRDVQLFQRGPQGLVEVVVEPVLPDGDRIDIDRLEIKLLDAAARFPGGFVGVAQVVSPAPATPGPVKVSHVESPTSLGTQEPPSPATLGGERKQVTVLVGEIPETLALLRDRDAEVVQQLVEPALQAMMDAVHRYGGMVHQVRGTGLLALFGAPLAHEDHALRACYAALAMQTALRGYADNVQRTHGWTLQSCIGLHAGEVVIRARGHDGLREPSLLGPTTALAERLQQWAPPGTIVLSATTARLVAGATRVTAVGRVTLAGLAEPVEVYELHEASGRPGRLHTARARGLTPLVGRQEELAALHRVLPQAAAGHGQLVAVVGEAGVGKSRLVDEWLQAAAAEGWRVLDSAAGSYGQAIPYFPVLALLRRYWHLEEGEALATIAAKVTAQVGQLDAALQDTIPALLAVLDALPADNPFLSLDPPQRRQHTFTALKRLKLLPTLQRSRCTAVSPRVRWRMPVHTRHGVPRRMPCASSATSRRGTNLRRAIRPKSITARR